MSLPSPEPTHIVSELELALVRLMTLNRLDPLLVLASVDRVRLGQYADGAVARGISLAGKADRFRVLVVVCRQRRVAASPG